MLLNTVYIVSGRLLIVNRNVLGIFFHRCAQVFRRISTGFSTGERFRLFVVNITWYIIGLCPVGVLELVMYYVVLCCIMVQCLLLLRV